MHVGIDGNEANVGERVGSNVYAWQVLTWLKKVADSESFTVYLKSAPKADLPKETDRWKNRVLKPSFLWTRWRLPLDLYLKKPKPNVFFTPGHYAPQFCPIPFAVAIMDLSFLHYPEMFRKKDLLKLRQWTKDSIKRAVHIFTISQFTKDDIIKNYDIPEEKISVAYPGVSGQILKSSPSAQSGEVKRKYQIQGDYLLYLGTLQPRKNLEKLIEAFSSLKGRNVSLVLAGKKGWLYSEILRRGKELGVASRVVFPGYVPQEEVADLMKGARALVNVSLYEGFGIPVLEAMALGVPTLVSETSSLPEITGDLSVTVNPEDVKSISRGLSRVLQINEVQRKEISVKSKKKAATFRWKNTAEKILEVLHEIAI